jgi:hypothetical protein
MEVEDGAMSVGHQSEQPIYRAASYSVSLPWRRSWPVRRSAHHTLRFSTRSAKSGLARLCSRRVWNPGSMMGALFFSLGGIGDQARAAGFANPQKALLPIPSADF